MRITIKVALITAAVWIAFKLIGLSIGWNTPEKLPVFILTNILGVLVAISIGLYLQKKNDTEGSNTLRDIKNAMTAGVPYTLVVCIFLYFYYENIDPEFNQKMIEQRDMYFLEALDNPETLKEIKSSKPDFEVMTKEEIYQSLRATPQMLFSGKFIMTMGMLSLLLLSTFYSILVTIIFRRLIFR